MSQRKTVVRFAVREAGGIKIQSELLFPSPLNPTLKMFRLQVIPFHLPTAGFRVTGMQIQPMLSWNERQRGLQVSAKFIGGARLSRISAGHREPAADVDAGILKSADIVTLPAMQRNRNLRKLLHRRMHIDAQIRIPFYRQRECTFNRCRMQSMEPFDRCPVPLKRSGRIMQDSAPPVTCVRCSEWFCFRDRSRRMTSRNHGDDLRRNLLRHDELVSFRSDCQNRARCFADDSFGDAAHQDVHQR